MFVLRFFGAFFLGAFFVFSLWIYVLGGEIYDGIHEIHPENLPPSSQPVDVILCLAGAKGRIQEAAQLWLTLRAQNPQKNDFVLFLSGVGEFTTWEVLQEQLHLGLGTQIPKQFVHLDTKSRNTIENIEIFLDVLKENPRWHRIILLTSNYHLRRSEWILRRALQRDEFLVRLPKIEVIPLALPSTKINAQNWRETADGIRITALEYMKWIIMRFRV